MALRLLSIDDEEALLFLSQLILELQRYDLRLASSGFPQVMEIIHLSPDLMYCGLPCGESRAAHASVVATERFSTHLSYSTSPTA